MGNLGTLSVAPVVSQSLHSILLMTIYFCENRSTARESLDSSVAALEVVSILRTAQYLSLQTVIIGLGYYASSACVKDNCLCDKVYLLGEIVEIK